MKTAKRPTLEETLRQILADEYGIMSNDELVQAIAEMKHPNIGVCLNVTRTGLSYCPS